MEKPEIWSHRASGGYLDKHAIASERWEHGKLRISTYGVPGADRSRAFISTTGAAYMHEKVGEYLHNVPGLLVVMYRAVRFLEEENTKEWSYERHRLVAQIREKLALFTDPDREPELPEWTPPNEPT
jgi:hypothetical protein